MIHRVLLSLLLLGCLGSGLGLVYTEQYSRNLLDKRSDLQRQQNELELEWQQLRLEQSAITAKAIVHDVARSQLQMVEPEPTDVIYIKP
ncbi:MAG: cell division protein FtsL [Candidatus Competibacteraceae bacterium]|nr:cell division protein FtsL [Candidatus Competibacteraceae bacterium]MCB1803986.1 cell division protein FtsL [Candidatus Competibacteraceae bacterium]MCB1813639.1 cell division protein FtsL [Candidatus Competibacteraceae bacterium]